MDSIRIHDIEVHGRHGVYAEERARGQLFRVSLELFFSQQTVGHSDGLDDTVDYSAVIALAAKILAGEPRHTIEAVASDIATAVLAAHPRVESVEVALTKPQPPVEATFNGVTATIRRTRQP